MWQLLQAAPRCGPCETGKCLSWLAGTTIPPRPVLSEAVDELVMALGSMNAGLHAVATWHCEQSWGNGGEVAVPR